MFDYRFKVPKVTEVANLWFLTDQHLGNADCALSKIVKVRDQVLSDPQHSRGVLGGDCCDFVNFSDKRFDIRKIAEDFRPDLDNLALSVAKYFVEVYRPLAESKQLIGLVPGNHEETIRQRYHTDVGGYIAGALGIPYLQQVDMIRISVEDEERNFVVKGVLSHAEKGATTASGKLAACERMASHYDDIDFFAQAHTHEYLHRIMPRVCVRGRFGSPRREERRVVLFLTGGYLKTYGEGFSGYGAKKGYAPCELGSPRLKMVMERTSGPRGKSVDRKVLSGE